MEEQTREELLAEIKRLKAQLQQAEERVQILSDESMRINTEEVNQLTEMRGQLVTKDREIERLKEQVDVIRYMNPTGRKWCEGKCGTLLTGRQRKWCSNTCEQRAQRREKNSKKLRSQKPVRKRQG